MVLAIKDKDRVIVASSIKDAKKDISDNDSINEENLLVHVSGDAIYGFGKLSREQEILRYDEEFNGIEINDGNLLKRLIPHVKKRIIEERGLSGKDVKDLEWENCLIIVKDNRIFKINSSFELIEYSDWIYGGWYWDYVEGSLESTKGQPAEVRIRKAVETLRKFGGCNLYPLAVVDSKDKNIRIWEK